MSHNGTTQQQLEALAEAVTRVDSDDNRGWVFHKESLDIPNITCSESDGKLTIKMQGDAGIINTITGYLNLSWDREQNTPNDDGNLNLICELPAAEAEQMIAKGTHNLKPLLIQSKAAAINAVIAKELENIDQKDKADLLGAISNGLTDHGVNAFRIKQVAEQLASNQQQI